MGTKQILTPFIYLGLCKLQLQSALCIHKFYILVFNQLWIENICEKKTTIKNNTHFKIQYNKYLYSTYVVLGIINNLVII